MARILVIDDDKSITRSLSWWLQDMDHEVTEANDGDEALSLFKPGDYDLVITDEDMPRMSGGALTQKLKSLEPQLPIILRTGGNEPDNHQADIFLEKTGSLDEFKEAIEKVLQK